jgi:ATP-dependent RNA helicase DeaD
MSIEDAFSSLSPALAEALRQRGFAQLTPVQEAVLDPEHAGFDLRISSQTGSGKTVALGLVLAPDVETATTTAGLVIAPTRELAAQIGRELTWLYAGLDASVAVVAGGASYRDEHRALAQRPRIVVGTPGRLLDHLERKTIDVSTLTAVVLDEADQMLDLGFRDALDAILGHLPPERRTHMVSATFGREVEALASRYQRTPRVVFGTAPGHANADIEHVIHVVRPNETLDAIINLLLIAPGERTLLFVRTRADASALSERLTQEGLFALPLSGDLEQKERNKTLEAFRAGAVSTLVATDVAARGLDIPDVSRVIHVDAPTELEGFTHRSGRTGRAGNKGTSIVLVPPAGRERVRRLLGAAKVRATWAAVPTPDEVRAAVDDRLFAELSSALAAPPKPEHAAIAVRLAEAFPEDTVGLIATLLARAGYPGATAPRAVTAIEADAPRAPRPHRADYVAFRVNWGEAHGADPRRLMALVCRRGGIRGDQVGQIRIGYDGSTFEVDARVAREFAFAARRRDPRDANVWIELAAPVQGRGRDEGPRGDARPDRADRRPHAGPARPERRPYADQAREHERGARAGRPMRREPRGRPAAEGRDTPRGGDEHGRVWSNPS